MTDILEHIQQYAPVKEIQKERSVPVTPKLIDDDQLHQIIPVGGNYSSVAQARGSQLIRINSECSRDKMEQMLPVAEDWHAKLCLLEVIQ